MIKRASAPFLHDSATMSLKIDSKQMSTPISKLSLIWKLVIFRSLPKLLVAPPLSDTISSHLTDAKPKGIISA
jgi:hypothetical protein